MRGVPSRLQQAWAGRGPLAWMLAPVGALHAAAVRLRQGLYRAGWLASDRLPVPVIVVGNLVAGGAGKTPTVRALVELLARNGYSPGVISRGYGGDAAGVVAVERGTSPGRCGDEPLLLHLRTGVPVFVGADRLAAGRSLLAAHPHVDVLVTDDGLQHLRLERQVQVVVFDERGVGNGWLLPAGPLREPFSSQVPPRTVVLYNAPAPTTSWPGTVVQRGLGGAVELSAWWQGAPAQPQALQALRGRRLVAAAGVARPERFFDMLRAAGLDFEPLPLADHHPYAALPWPPETPDVLVTEKDAVKLDPARLGSTRAWVAALDFVPSPAFEAHVLRLLESSAPSLAHVAPHAHGNPSA